jgi:hypothetical protein
LGTQDTGRRQTKQKYRHTQQFILELKKNMFVMSSHTLQIWIVIKTIIAYSILQGNNILKGKLILNKVIYGMAMF